MHEHGLNNCVDLLTIAERKNATFLFAEQANESEVIHFHSKSFSTAARLLPREIRKDVCKLYAWCRWCDDAVDDAPSYDVAKARLQVLRDDIENIYSGNPVILPASRWLQDIICIYDIPVELPMDLLLGMESDLEFSPLEDTADLEIYCYRVAGVVGLMMCRLLGVEDKRAYENANRLGIAMQMTNIARDVAEDWRRGRCYIPRTWLDLDPKSSTIPSDLQVRESVKRLLGMAKRNYEIGRAGLKAIPPRARLAIRVAASVYEAIGTKIERQNFMVMQHRHFVSTSGKLTILAGEVFLDFAGELFRRLPKKTLKIARHNSQTDYPTLYESESMKTEFQYLAIFGLSMTLIMATVLFALVGINPKMETYELSPWIYSIGSAVGATVLWFWSHRIGKNLSAAEARISD